MEYLHYLLLWLILCCGIYLLPATSLFPRVVFELRSAVTLPLLNIALLYGLQKILFTLDLYDSGKFSAAVITLSAIGVVRVMMLRRGTRFLWPREQLVLLAFTALLCLPILVELSLSSFATDDEIYSWNYWAKQLFLSHEPDFHYTGAPYPQAFSVLLSNAYQLLGSHDYQLPVKGTLFLLPLICFGAIALCARSRNQAVLYVALLVFFLYALEYRKEFDNGLADPLMATCLVLGFYSLLQRRRFARIGSGEGLLIAVVLISLAALTKQAAIPWALLAFPVLVWLTAERTDPRWHNALAVLAPAGVIAIWFLTEGAGFADNSGVIGRSLAGRGYLEQMVYAARIHLLGNLPLLLFLMVFAVSLRPLSALNLTVMLAILLSLAIWFLFGAYEFRLGMHLALLAWLFLAWQEYGRLGRAVEAAGLTGRPKLAGALAGTLLFASIAYAGILGQKKLAAMGEARLLAGSENQVVALLGPQGLVWYRQVRQDPGARTWVASNYLFGILFDNTPVTRPVGAIIDERALLRQLRQEEVSHAVYLDRKQYWYGPGNAALQRLRGLCPGSFQANRLRDSKMGAVVLRFLPGETCRSL